MVGEGVSEPGIEQVPALLREEQLQELGRARAQDVDVDTFGHKFLGEFLH